MTTASAAHVPSVSSVGAVVLLLQVFLQPGKAVSNGVAAIRLGYGPQA